MPYAATITRDSNAVPGVKFTLHRMGFARRTDLDFQTLKFRQRLRELEADSPPRSEQEKLLNEQLSIAIQKSKALQFAQGEETEAAARAEAKLQMPPDEFAERVAAHAAALEDVVSLSGDLEASIPSATKAKRMVLNEEYVQIEARIQAAWVRAGLVSIMHRKGDEPVADGLDGMSPDQLLDYGPQALTIEVYGVLIVDGRLDGAAIKNSSAPITSGGVVDGAKTSTTAPDAAALPADGTSKETVSATSPAT
jgi:hypothetical protein